MNYVYPTRQAFIVPHGTVLKHTKESSELKEQRESLRKCLNKTLSVNGKKVDNSKPTNNE